MIISFSIDIDGIVMDYGIENGNDFSAQKTVVCLMRWNEDANAVWHIISISKRSENFDSVPHSD